MLRESPCAVNADVGIDVLLALKSWLVAWWGRRALQMNVAAIAANSRVETLVNKLDGEAESIAIKRKRAGNIGDAKTGAICKRLSEASFLVSASIRLMRTR